jgi:hypothetical protein
MATTPDPERLNEVVFLEDDTDNRRFTESLLIDFIRNTYPPPEYAVLDHVRNATGHVGNVRTADAIMFSTYPSRGLYLYGFEIKCHRADWLSELRDPAKAEEIGRYCDFWYVVAPRGVVRDGEVPQNWGWLAPEKTRLKVMKKPVRNENAQPLSREFAASIMRKFHERTRSQDELKAAREKGIEIGRRQAVREMTDGDPVAHRIRRDLDDIKKSVAEFQKASGIDLSERWMGKRVGEIVAFLQKHDWSLEMGMKSLRSEMENMLKVTKEFEKQFTIHKR